MIFIILVLIWRIYLFFIAFVSSKIASFSPTFPYSEIYLTKTNLPQFLWAWGNFDGVHYLTIAKQGYFAQFTQAFFPVFPLLLRFSGWIFRDDNIIISGIILTFIFLLVAVITLNKLIRLDYPQKTAYWSVIFLLTFPTSFFFAALYTESLFLLLTTLSFWYARKHKWWLSGVCAGIASATRITGVFLIPALLWEFYKTYCKKQNVLNKKNNKLIIIIHKILHFAFCILHSPILYLAPLGLISYMIYLQIKFNDWLYFWHAQVVFGAERSGYGFILPVQTMWRYIKIFFTASPGVYHYWTAVWELGSFLSGIGLLLIGHKQRIRLSYLIFSWMVFIVPALTGTFSSMPRYLLSAFPIFIILGNFNSRFLKIILGAGFILLQIIFIMNFISGRWVA